MIARLEAACLAVLPVPDRELPQEMRKTVGLSGVSEGALLVDPAGRLDGSPLLYCQRGRRYTRPSRFPPLSRGIFCRFIWPVCSRQSLRKEQGPALTLPPPPASIRREHLALLILAFILTRGLAFYSGMRYQIAQTWRSGFLDISLLHHHMLRALLHLHAQPPC
jgi:hypothetical protein